VRRGRPTDVYALGACLYTLVFGRIPFSAPNLYKLFAVSTFRELLTGCYSASNLV
jgi:serine/threonine protein kinase